MQGKRINRDDPVLVGQFIESRQPLHIVRILIHAMQQNDHRVAALRVVALWQAYDEVAVCFVDRYLFFRLLRPERRAQE
jgi:hypothetical protein